MVILLSLIFNEWVCPSRLQDGLSRNHPRGSASLPLSPPPLSHYDVTRDATTILDGAKSIPACCGAAAARHTHGKTHLNYANKIETSINATQMKTPLIEKIQSKYIKANYVGEN